MYITTNQKLLLAIFFSFIWASFSFYLAQPWIEDLNNYYHKIWSYCLVLGIAIIPGFFNAFLVASLFLDKRPEYGHLVYEDSILPPISILIAAFNEEDTIADTLDSILKQDYPGEIEVFVSDDGSSDNTAELVREFIINSKPLASVKNINFNISTGFKNIGKSGALKRVLAQCQHDLVITIDADSYLYKDALKNMVSNYVHGPKNTAAIAGTVLVRNSRKNWLTKLQEWEYFISLSLVKRSQSLFQGTLVAQGAFSLYRKDVLQEVGGWPDVVGEDIALTWGIQKLKYRVGHAENAIIFTNAPEDYKTFFNQRRRWSRGLIEAFKRYPEVIWTLKPNSVFIWLNLMFPFLDFMFVFGFIPGLIFALIFQWYAIVSILTIMLLPMAIIMNYLIYRSHVKTFEAMDLKVRKNIFGYFTFMLICQAIMAPACLRGYLDEFLKLKKSWGTKNSFIAEEFRLWSSYSLSSRCSAAVLSAIIFVGSSIWPQINIKQPISSSNNTTYFKTIF